MIFIKSTDPNEDDTYIIADRNVHEKKRYVLVSYKRYSDLLKIGYPQIENSGPFGDEWTKIHESNSI